MSWAATGFVKRTGSYALPLVTMGLFVIPGALIWLLWPMRDVAPETVKPIPES